VCRIDLFAGIYILHICLLPYQYPPSLPPSLLPLALTPARSNTLRIPRSGSRARSTRTSSSRREGDAKERREGGSEGGREGEGVKVLRGVG